MTDNDLSGSAVAKISLPADEATMNSFVIEYDVRFAHLGQKKPLLDGVQIRDCNDKTFMRYETYTCDGSAEASWNVTSVRYLISGDGTGTNELSEAKNLNIPHEKWHKMKMVYEKAEDGKSATATYYLDNVEIRSSTDVTVTNFNLLRFATDADRTSIMGVDNLVIFSLD